MSHKEPVYEVPDLYSTAARARRLRQTLELIAGWSKPNQEGRSHEERVDEFERVLKRLSEPQDALHGTEEGSTPHLREVSPSELKDPELKDFSNLLGSLSLKSVFIATKESDGKLTGSDTEDGSLRDSSNSKEKARVKQQKRRQRKRAQKRESMDPSATTHQAKSQIPDKKRKPSPNERSLRFFLGLYESDKPQLDFTPTTDQDWRTFLNASAALHRVRDDRIVNKTFEDESEMQDFVTKTREELIFLRKQQSKSEAVRTIINAKHEGDSKASEHFKFEYSSRLIPLIIDVMEVNVEVLSERLELAIRCRDQWTAAYGHLGKWKALHADQARLRDSLTSLIPGSPSWGKANSELKLTDATIEQMEGTMSTHKEEEERAWRTGQEALGNPP